MVDIQGVDYSRTANGDWAGLANTLKANGKQFVVRYAVSDRSPTGRGITAPEYAAMRDAGIDVGLYWEGTESWMLGGYNAGVAAAENAQANIVAAGLPETMPIYFAHDIDPQPIHFAAIDGCLNGCAAVVGWERVGVYGGWLLMDYMAQGGTIRWLAQTSAWEYGRGVHPRVNLYQYAYNQYFAGTNCDLVRALTPEWGQAASFLAPPTPEPVPVPTPSPSVYPKGMTRKLAEIAFGSRTHTFDGKKRTFAFDPDGPISREWLARIKAQLAPGEDYSKATYGHIVRVTRRGRDKVRWDVYFSDGSTIVYDSASGRVMDKAA